MGKSHSSPCLGSMVLMQSTLAPFLGERYREGQGILLGDSPVQKWIAMLYVHFVNVVCINKIEIYIADSIR